MRNDQIFVLMLVILLPMSGCFDGAVGDAEGTDEGATTTVVNNYYNNTTTVEPNIDSVMTVHIAEGQTETIILNGTTLQLMTMYYVDGNGNWNSYGTSLPLSMTCSDGFSMTAYLVHGPTSNSQYLPNLPGVECQIILNWQNAEANAIGPASEKILTFKEVNLETLI